jgi:GH35 family endo-1,4-beta-xylanase
MLRLPYAIILLLILSAMAVQTMAAPLPDLLAPGEWIFSSPHPGDAFLDVVNEAGAPGGGEVQRLTVTAPSSPLWLIQFDRSIPANVPEGDLLKMHFWARSTTLNPVRVTLEQSAAPFQAVTEAMLTLTADWREFTIQGLSPGLGPNALSAHFQGGESTGTMEITGVTVVDLGIDPSLAGAKKAIQPDQVQARIEKYRKGDLTVRVVDAYGKPMKNVSVEVSQTKHAFLFGCNIFGLTPSDQSATQIAYQNEFAALFNYATLPFYWGAFESQEGKPDYARLQAMADWCVAHGISPKGHPLVWHQVWPYWAPNIPDDAIPLLKARVSDLIPRYKDTIHYWDVLNEANGAGGTTPPNGESAWIVRDGPASVVGTALGWARAAGSGLDDTFIYNDYETGQSNVNLLMALQTKGQLPDAIGIQSHMHGGVWPLTKVWETCETFGKFGKPLHFTETTVLSGPTRNVDDSKPYPTDWYTTPDDEAKQADYAAQFYSLLFSHPSVRAITWWDFSDLNAWRNAPSGLVRKDMTPKPAYTRLMDLIHHQWWTKAQGITNRSGSYSLRAFYGDYAITVTDSKGRSKTVSAAFPESAPPLSITVSLP